MQHVFGPVPTRRLGRSLGIDTVPLKTCNWNCAYCQLGRTRRLTIARREYFPVAEILAEVEQRLHLMPDDAFDWITFVASGEGTLHAALGGLIRAVKRLSRHPVAVITNGALLHRAEVREELAVADAVLPTLDAGDPRVYRRLNRPHPSLSYELHVAGLEAFARQQPRGRLWIEVMLVAGCNDTEPGLCRLADVLARIAPDEVHLLLPTRCPAASWVQPPAEERVECARDLLGAAVKAVVPTLPLITTPESAALEDEILGIVTRHPWRRADLPRLFGRTPAEAVDRAVASLYVADRVRFVERYGQTFVAAAASRYDEPAHNPDQGRAPLTSARNPSRHTLP